MGRGRDRRAARAILASLFSSNLATGRSRSFNPFPLFLLFASTYAVSSLPAFEPAAGKTPSTFQVKLLAIDANEGIVAGDVDGDGQLDLVAGRNWYRGGDWAPRPLRNVED